MKSILALLLALPYVLGVETTGRPRHQQAGDTRQCIQGAVCLDFRDGDPISFRARGHIRRCPTPDHGCGIIRKFGVSRELNDERTDVDPNTVNKGYKTINMGCVAPGLCELIVGVTSDSGCAYILAFIALIIIYVPSAMIVIDLSGQIFGHEKNVTSQDIFDQQSQTVYSNYIPPDHHHSIKKNAFYL
eukprot:345932_1